jgi:Fe-S cluster biogenesis protein NfuA
MEKYSVESIEKYKKVLSEKYKYLLVSEMKNYEIQDVWVTDVSFEGGRLVEIDVDVQLDYQGACDSDSNSIGYMLTKISNDLHEFFSEKQIDPKTMRFSDKRITNQYVNDPQFLNFNYKMDELHEGLVWVRINYDYE